jgi:DNA-binding transcriptional ArsR family regulator
LNEIRWDQGTAYDFFISLFVLHNPDLFGLRASWAAGVRSRIPLLERQFLEDTLEFLPAPLIWLNSLDVESKDAATVLEQLVLIPAESRLITLFKNQQFTPEVGSTIQKIRTNREVEKEDLNSLRLMFQKRMLPIKPKAIEKLAKAFINAELFGDQLLASYQAYFNVFFREEEIRIRPFIENGLFESQKIAETLSLSDLFFELSKGVSIDSLEVMDRLWLVPSYWSSPLIFLIAPRQNEKLMVFGCRSEDQNLIPGEYVPDALMNMLKALSDSTRFRIVRYLQEEPETPSSLAKKLRLRAPTVIHHLNIMRLAGLVQVKISADGERSYALREQAIVSITQQIDGYFNKKPGSM